MRRLIVLSTLCLLGAASTVIAAGLETLAGEAIAPAAPDAVIAGRLFPDSGPLRLERIDDSPPGWTAIGTDGVVGYIASTWEIAGSVGYSGRPIDVLVGVTPDARIAGAELMRHDEPVLTLGISTEDIADYVGAFSGLDLTREQVTAFGARSDLPDVIARATVSTGVIRDAILRTSRTLAIGRGIAGGRGVDIDRVSFAERSWDELLAEGALAGTTVPMAEARAGLAGASSAAAPRARASSSSSGWRCSTPRPSAAACSARPSTPARWARSVRAIPRSSSVRAACTRTAASTGAVRGVFERIEVIQGEETIALRQDDFLRIDRLAAEGAPDLKEMSVFRLDAARFDPAAPFRVEVTATRPTAEGEVALRIPLAYSLPAEFLLPPAAPPETAPLWVSAWQAKRPQIAGLGVMLTVLSAILFFQESFVRRPKLWLRGRYAFLTVTLVWLGWIAGGQLSVRAGGGVPRTRCSPDSAGRPS